MSGSAPFRGPRHSVVPVLLAVFLAAVVPASGHALTRFRAPETVALPTGVTALKVASGDMDGDGNPELAVYGSDRRIHVYGRVFGRYVEQYTTTTPSSFQIPAPTVRFSNNAAVVPGAGYVGGQFFYNLFGPKGPTIESIRRSTSGTWSEDTVFTSLYSTSVNGGFSDPVLLPALQPNGLAGPPAWRLVVAGGSSSFDPPMYAYLPRFGESRSHAGMPYNSDIHGYCEQSASDVPDEAAGDFNGDGTNEVALLRAGGVYLTSTASVAYNATNGCWNYQKYLVPTPIGHTQMVTGHLDANNTTDIVVRDVDGRLHILRGRTGPGAFAFDTTTVTSGRPFFSGFSSDVALADLDGDGDTDIVQAYSSPCGYQVLLNDGAGGFTGQFYSLEPNQGQISALSLVDVDGDGVADLVLAQSGVTPARLVILPGLGHGTFGLPQGLSTGVLEPTALAVIDSKGQGRLDPIIGGMDTDPSDGMQDMEQVYNFPGNLFGPVLVSTPGADPAFGIRQMIGYRANSQAVPADAPLLDVLQAHGNGVTTVDANGDLQPLSFTYSTTGDLNGIDRADVDGDGLTDGIRLEFLSNRTSYVTIDATAQGSIAVPLTDEQSGVRAIDWDGDGLLDLVTLNRSSNQIEVRFQDGGGGLSFSGLQIYPLSISAMQPFDQAKPFLEVPMPAGSPHVLAVRGYDNNNSAPRIQIVRSDAGVGEVLALPGTYDDSHTAFLTGDADGDSLSDILVATQNTNTGEASLYTLRGVWGSPVTWTMGTSYTFGVTTITDMVLADVDLDGDPDLLTVGSETAAPSAPAFAASSRRAPLRAAIAGTGMFTSVLAYRSAPEVLGVGAPKHRGDARRIALAVAPNPVRQGARLSYDLPVAAHVTADLFDVAGRRVRRLIDADRPAGAGSDALDARDDAGHPLGAGLYFVRMRAGQAEGRRTLVVIH